MRLPTASKLSLVDECPPSWVLPRIRETHDAADEGRDKHTSLRAALEGNVDALRQEDDWRDAVLELLADRQNMAELHEAAYAYDVATGRARFLGCDLGRNYGQTETEFAGAADWVLDRGDVLEVWDLKTGLAPSESIEHHAQLRMLACAVGLTHQRPVQTFLLLAPRDGQRPRIVTGPRYEVFDLYELAEWLLSIYARIETERRRGDPRHRRYSVGKWCATCAARLSCPTQVEMVRRLVQAPDDAAGDIGRALAMPETRALAYHRLRAAEKALQWARGQLYASVREYGPIDLGKGRVFGPHEETSEAFDPEVAWPWLVERFGVDVAKAAMSLETSKTRIGKALSVAFPRGKKTALVDAALDELRALPGAVERKTKTTIEEHELRAARPALAGDASVRPPTGAAPALSAGKGQEEQA